MATSIDDNAVIGQSGKLMCQLIYIRCARIVFEKNSVIIKVSEVDYKKILEIKTIYEIEVVKVYGIAYFKAFIKKYWLFFVFLFLGFLMF